MDTPGIADIIQAAMVVVMKLARAYIACQLGNRTGHFNLSGGNADTRANLTFVPKLIAIAAILMIMGSWMMEVLSDFMRYIFLTRLLRWYRK
jgi:flagellar biosynthetic protein FliQ